MKIALSLDLGQTFLFCEEKFDQKNRYYTASQKEDMLKK